MTTKTDYLFSWEAIEGRSDLDRLHLALDYLPSEHIIKALEAKRSHGRDDFPVHAMWNALIAGIVYQHPSIESLSRELSRNPALLAACGFNPLPVQSKPKLEIVKDTKTGKEAAQRLAPKPPEYAYPKAWNFSRFMASLIQLEEEEGLIKGMIKTLRHELAQVLPHFGQHLGYDGKAIQSNSTGSEDKKTKQASDPEADWGMHKISGVNKKSGKPWEKIKSWFGYRVHLIAETHYEIPVDFELTRASISEQKVLPEQLKKLFKESPELSVTCETFTADRGLDQIKLRATLWDSYQIKPVIGTRQTWHQEKQDGDYDPEKPITRALFADRVDTVVHTEKGEVKCVNPCGGEIRDMAYQGFEASRGTLKYRCPAAAFGYECAGRAQCEQQGGVNAGEYGRVVRIKITEQDRRVFTPIPQGTPSFKRAYDRRSALERINNRIDNSFCFEKHFIRGKAKMTVKVGLALTVMMAMALGHAKENRLEQIRSLVSAVPPPQIKLKQAVG